MVHLEVRARNAAGAVELARAVDRRGPVVTPWLTEAVQESASLAAESLPRTQNIVWGDDVVWREAIDTNQQLRAANVVTGDAKLPLPSVSITARAMNIVWVNDAVRGASVV